MIDPALIGAILIGGLIVLLAIGAPVSISIGLPSAICLLLVAGFDNGAMTSVQQMFRGANSFALLAIPFFVLAGVIMNNGGIAARLINLARVLVGRTPAPLMQSNVIANAIFGTVSGSAVATAAAVGSTMSPMLRKEGYDRSMAAAANVASAPAGMLIPPSNTLIVYSLAAGGTSVGALFMAGYIPGILWALVCAAVVWFYARRHPELKGQPFPGWGVFFSTVLQALPSLGLIVVAIGGIVAGFFTPTEGSAIAVVYALVLSFLYRTIHPRDLAGILYDACRTSAIVIFLIAVSSIMGYVMTYARLPQLIADALFGWTDSKVVVLLIMMVLLLLIGIPLDPTPALLIFVPIFLPIAVSYGIDPVHFGIMMVFNLSIAVISPPSAPVLFVGTQVAKARLEPVIVKMVPFLIALIAMLFVVVFVPDLSLWLPRLVGLVN
ncbi:TRAP transporter large permease [Microbacterium sp.]|uniref:TRAP transporter large permease n=1 Tax=Microbacterium sp. TaxID=51671 RepID=UPI0028122E39|nr:TRAP transporter large permease [Microbacterium sp.]